jgi:hypothetical protein
MVKSHIKAVHHNINRPLLHHRKHTTTSKPSFAAILEMEEGLFVHPADVQSQMTNEHVVHLYAPSFQHHHGINTPESLMDSSKAPHLTQFPLRWMDVSSAWP